MSQRIETIFSELLAQHGGPYLFGSQFTIADAYYAPVCMRFETYALSQRRRCRRTFSVCAPHRA